MEDILLTLWGLIASGDAKALSAFFFCTTCVLSWLVYRNMKEIKVLNQKVSSAKDAHLKSIEKILDKYNASNINLTQALNEIKVVLSTIQRLS